MRFYTFCQRFLAAYVRFAFGVKVEGMENVPDGPLLVCCNHMSQWDPVCVGACVKTRQIKFMAKKELFKIPFVKTLVKALGAFPVNRGGADVSAIKKAISLLSSGDCIGIFPQGTRSPGKNPRETEIRGGTGMCAFHSKCNVLPVAIVNKKMKMALFQKTYIVIGKPIKYDELPLTDGDKEQFANASKYIFDKVCDLFEQKHAQL